MEQLSMNDIIHKTKTNLQMKLFRCHKLAVESLIKDQLKSKQVSSEFTAWYTFLL